MRLGLLLGLIVFGSILSVASPFLLREAVDKGIVGHDLTLLTWLVAGMIALAVINGVISVAQTWISNEVGQRVMHDLRAAVYAHLQRMSLAFFTRTRSGEVQARIAYDIGGIDDVVTSTATSTVSTVATVTATIVAMFALSWQLTVFSLILLPFFVWLTRRVGNERRRIQSVRQSRLADMSTLVEESLSVSGILLGKTMGRSSELVNRFSSESSELADLEVRARMAGRWRMASVQMSFAIMPAAVYWFSGYSIVHGEDVISIGTVVAFTTLQTRLLFPMQQLLSVGPGSADLARAVRAHLRVPRPARGHRGAPGCAHAERRARRCAPGGGVVSLRPRCALDAGGDLGGDPGRHAHRARRRDRLGQDHARLSGGAAV